MVAGVANVASALQFQTDASGDNAVKLDFTFGETINITLPSDTITISDLTPGTSGVSASSYAVTVNTNAQGGYTLSATVGCGSGDTGFNSTCFDSTELENGTNTFAMITSNGALSAGKWGIALVNDETVSSFKTLAKWDGTATVLKQTDVAGGGSTPFRIGAQATNSQEAGTYKNRINFTAVTNVTANCGDYMADYCMQDVGTWGSGLSTGQEVQAIDARDGKTYTVAKLADNNIWMTQNLDHDIKTDGSVTYDSTTTDIPSAWTPSTATFASGTTTWDTTATGRTTPQSYDPGDICWDGTINEDWDGTLDNETTACGSDKHMSIGNYYNWTAAVAMNDSSSYTTQNTDVNQSICPAGWRLPIGGTTNTGSKSFQYLWNQYSSTFNDSTMMNSPLYFSYAGSWYGISEDVGSNGYYWSSVVNISNNAYVLNFGSDIGVYPQSVIIRYYGISVRCVAR